MPGRDPLSRRGVQTAAAAHTLPTRSASRGGPVSVKHVDGGWGKTEVPSRAAWSCRDLAVATTSGFYCLYQDGPSSRGEYRVVSTSTRRTASRRRGAVVARSLGPIPSTFKSELDIWSIGADNSVYGVNTVADRGPRTAHKRPHGGDDPGSRPAHASSSSRSLREGSEPRCGTALANPSHTSCWPGEKVLPLAGQRGGGQRSARVLTSISGHATTRASVTRRATPEPESGGRRQTSYVTDDHQLDHTDVVHGTHSAENHVAGGDWPVRQVTPIASCQPGAIRQNNALKSRGHPHGSCCEHGR